MKPVDSPKGQPVDIYLRRIYLSLVALAVLSCLGLDFLAARRGAPAYLFSSGRRPEARPAAPDALADLTVRLFTEAGLAAEDVRTDRDEAGHPRCSIELAEEAYQKLVSPLESVFREHGATANVEEGESDGRTTYSWHVQRGDREKLTLLFSCRPSPRPEIAAPPAPATATPLPAAAPEKLAAIIIDDMGNSLDVLQDVFDLGIPLTVAILPRSPYALETAQAAHDRDFEVILHLPCESLNHQEVLPPLSPIIRSDMGPDEIRALVAESLDSVPFVIGVNNHMGSKLTQDRAAMIPVLDVLKERRLFFIDSVTAGRSIAYDQARKMGVRSAYRHVFLDSEVGADYSREKLAELFKLAKKNGRAIAIGHPFPETIQALKDSRALARKYGIRLVPASAIVPD